MLKAIKFYLLDDEDKQTSLEVESAYAIKKNKENNNVFLSYKDNFNLLMFDKINGIE